MKREPNIQRAKIYQFLLKNKTKWLTNKDIHLGTSISIWSVRHYTCQFESLGLIESKRRQILANNKKLLKVHYHILPDTKDHPFVVKLDLNRVLHG